MDKGLVFLIEVVGSGVVFALVAIWFLAPKLVRRPLVGAHAVAPPPRDADGMPHRSRSRVVDSNLPRSFATPVAYGDYIYVAPDADAVIVRSGRDWGVDNDTWLATFRDIADRLAGPS